MTDFSAAAMDLEADVVRQGHAIAQLTDWIGKLQDRVAQLEAANRPPALVTGPPWPGGTVYRGAAPTAGAVAPTGHPATVVTLRPRTEGSSSSDTHEVHVTRAERLTRYAWDVDLILDPAMLDAVTWKFGGMAGFDGNWTAWPGGDTSAGAAATTNCMERLVGSNTTHARLPADSRYGAYATFPTPVATIPAGAQGVTATVGGAKAWVTNRGHTCHWQIDSAPARPAWAHHRREVDTVAGTLRHLIDGDEVLALTGLPFPTIGMNRVYVSCMIGGSAPEFLPRTPDRTGTLTYGGFTLR